MSSAYRPETSFSAGSGLPADGVKASAAADASDKNPCSLESACSGASASSSQRTVTPIAVPMPSSRLSWKMTPQIGGSSAEREVSPMYRVSLTEIVTGIVAAPRTETAARVGHAGLRG